MQKKNWVNFIFLRKKGDFSDVFSAFYGQRSLTAAWATRSPWSIYFDTTRRNMYVSILAQKVSPLS